MDSATQDNLNYLLTLSLEGAISAEQRDALHRSMGDSDEAMAYCLEFLETAACLYKAQGRLGAAPRETGALEAPEILGEVIERDEQVHAAEAAHLAEARREEIRKAAETALARFKEQERRRQEELAHRKYLAHRRQLAVGALAAVALVLVAVSIWVASRPERPVAAPIAEVITPPAPAALPVVAVVTRVSNVRWNRTSAAPIAGTDLTPGPIALDQGFVELTFPSQARLIIEAPAEVNLVDERRVRLEQGTLTAHVPEVARGFEVETPSARVTDLGTEFALEVDAGGAVDVHVLDGWVAASFTAAGHDDQERVKALYQDHAMRFDASQGTMRSIDVDGERFARSWDDVLYKPRIDGAVRFEWSTPVSLREGALEHDDFIRLLLERTDVSLGDKTTVSLTTAGRYTSFAGLSESLPAGARVDSYLLHWDPASTAGTRRIVSGRVMFRRPILGMVVTAEQLGAGDALFGLSGTAYPAQGISRRLESASDVQNADTIVLSADRLSLEVKLRASSLDQIRVLVAAPSVEER